MNPRYSGTEIAAFKSLLNHASRWKAHVWLSTSGSCSQKWVGLSKSALLASAQAVNTHLQSDKRDRWIKALPSFHVGGLGILARAHISGAAVSDYYEECREKWQAKLFYDYLAQKKGTLTALVPAQLHDLIVLGFSPPASLRAVIIGGGAMPERLYAEALALRWPVLPSYGMTECASQIATASTCERQAALEILPHIAVREEEGRLCFKGSSLLTTYALFEGETVHFRDPKVDGWFTSDDRGSVNGKYLSVHGREDNVIKIGGESVDLDRLEGLMQSLRLKLSFQSEVTLVATPHDRLGSVVSLAVEGEECPAIAQLIEHYNLAVLPFERIRERHFIPSFPRSALGKVLKKKFFSDSRAPEG